ncbi:GntR family transcriptional regulator [Actinomadura viridis]|uniref:GntR family transcriptional regulator n=1 Tax=Actinomadura viridis TaxID=58110 RepID=UPI0036C1B902
MTRASEVYEILRDEIVRGDLRPNQRITELELATRLEVSRTPIREALQMLARDELIVSRRRGWVVYEFTLAEIRHLSEIRAALEGYAAGLAARHAKTEDIDALEQSYRTSLDEVKADRRRIIVVNDRFHHGVNRLSGNPFLVKMIQKSRRYYFNYQAETLYSDDELWRSMSDHDFIIAALRRRDAETVERVARGHVEELIRVVEERLRPSAT